MPKVKYSLIGTGGFATPQAWFDAYTGDLVSSGLICVGYLVGEHTFGGSGVALKMTGSHTDAEHYYVLRGGRSANFGPDRSGFTGSFSPLDLVDQHGIKLTNIRTSGAIYCDVPHTKFQRFLITGASGSTSYSTNSLPVYRYGIFLDSNAKTSVIDGVGVHRFNFQASGYGSNPVKIHLVTAGIINLASGSQIRNCAINDLRTTALSNLSSIIQECTASTFGILSGKNLVATPSTFSRYTTDAWVVNNNITYLYAESTAYPTIAGVPFSGVDIKATTYGIALDCADSDASNYIGYTKNNIVSDVSVVMSGISSIGASNNLVWQRYISPTGEASCFKAFNTYSGYYPPFANNSASDLSVSPILNFTNQTLSDHLAFPSKDSLRTDLLSTSPLIGSGAVLLTANEPNFTYSTGRAFNHDIESDTRGTEWDIGADEYFAPSELPSGGDPCPCCPGGANYPCDMVIPPSIASGLVELYLHSPAPSDSVDLYLESTLNSISSGVDLYTIGHSTTNFFNNPTTNLFIEGGTPNSSGLTGFTDLYLHVSTSYDDSMNLFLKGEPIPSGAVNLYALGAVWTSGEANIPLYMRSAVPVSGYMNLYIEGTSTTGSISGVGGLGNNAMNLFLQGDPIPSGMVDLFMTGGQFIQVTSGIPLFTFSSIAFSGINDDARMNLVIVGVGTSGVANAPFNLYLEGVPYPFGMVDLFTTGSDPIEPTGPSGTVGYKDLYLDARVYSSGMMNLFLLGPDRHTVSGTIPLYMNGEGFSGMLDLSTHGKDSLTTTMNLVVGGPFPTITTGATELFLWATPAGVGGQANSVPMYMQGIGAIANMNLYIGSPDSMIINSNLNLYMNTNPSGVGGSVDLILGNYTIPSGINLWIGGSPLDGGPITDLNNDWNIGTAGMNLYIETNSLANTVQLFMSGHQFTTHTGTMNLSIVAVSGAPSDSVNMFMRSDPFSTTTLYTHGF